MAIDTRAKRFSMMTFAMHASQGTTMPLFEADGAVDQDDRQHLLGMYGGVAWAGGAPPPTGQLLQLAGEYRGGFNQGGFSS
jgi:hypothetical protein